MSDEVNFGVLGFGKMGTIRHRTLKSIPGCRIVAVYEPNTKINTPKNTHRVNEAKELIYRDDVDAVLVCTPNYLIKGYVIEALKAGKDVFSEKPPGISLKETIEMQDAVIQSKKKLMFGFNHRHHDSIIYAKKKVDSGQYGKILWMRGRYGKSVAPDFYSDWRSKKKYAGGGIFLDQGIHMLDLFMMMCGSFEEVQSMVSNLYWKGDIEDNVFAILRNKKGQVASLHSTMTQWRHLFSWEIFLEHGYIVINGLRTSSNSYGNETIAIARNRTIAPAATWTDQEQITYSMDNSWKRELGIFVDAVRHDNEITTCGINDAVKLMEMVEKIYRQ